MSGSPGAGGGVAGVERQARSRRSRKRPPIGVVVAAMFLLALVGVELHAAVFLSRSAAWTVTWLTLAAAMAWIAVGLVRRRNWARTAFLALLAVSIAFEVLFLFARQPGMSAWRILFAAAWIAYFSRAKVKAAFR